ncbi:MAG: histidinol-phosphate transaminase [Myxococcota bacterium]
MTDGPLPALVPENVARMIPYRPGKPAPELERELGITGALKLASNENPLGPSPKAVEAVKAAAPDLHLYPDGAAYRLREALAARHGVPMDEVVLGNGSNELIDLICRTFPGRDEHVVFGKPSFVCYWLGCTAAGVPYTEVPLRDDLHWDVDAMLAAVRPETKVLFLANPNNPTGAYVGRADLERLLRELPPKVIAVLDEAYVEFPDADDYVSALELRGLRERLLVLRTFSKAYGIAALRVGYAIGPAELVGYLHRMRAPFNVNALGQLGALAALDDAAHVERYVALNATERVRVARALGELGLEVAPSQANFLLVGFERPGAEVYDALLHPGVITRPMPSPLGRWLRITLGTAPMNDRLLEVLAKGAHLNHGGTR